MARKALSLTLMLAAVVAMAAFAGDEKSEGNQKLCPIMGNPINKEVYTDYMGYRVFFCCEGCIAEFEKDPAAHLEKMKSEGVEPMKLAAQTTCPVMGNPINKEVFTDYKGMRIYFCCAGCIEPFQAEPEKYLKVIADRGEIPEILKKDEGDS